MIRLLPAGLYAGDMIYCYFPAYDSNGASVTITGLAVTDIEIYKNGSTTQRASDNGYTLLDTDGIDFDASTGLHGFKVDTSDNSDAGFYADGSHYLIWVDAITADGQTVRFGFETMLGVVARPATAGRKINVTSGGTVEADLQTIKTQTVTCAGGVTIPAATLASTTNITAATGITVGTNNDKTGYTLTQAFPSNFSSLSIDASGRVDMGKVKGDDAAGLQTMNADTIAEGFVYAKAVAGSLTAADFSSDFFTEVWHVEPANAALGGAGMGYLLVTNIDAPISSRATPAQVNTEADTALADAGVTSVRMTNIDTAATRFQTMIVLDGSVYQFTANALELGPSGSGLTAQQTRDAMKLAPTAGAAATDSIDDKLDGLGDIAGIPGPGADECTINIKVGGTPVPDADVWITSDAAGDTIVAGTLQTDSSGDVTFLLDAGNTYYLWMQKDGYNSIEGTSFVAVAD
jgi:hypothetical protein